MGQAAIPLIMMAVGTGVQAYNTYDTNKRADQTAAAGLRAQGAKQRDADKVVDKLVTDTAASDPTDERNKAMQQFQQVLSQANGNVNAGLGAPGGASERFTQDQANAAAGVSEYGKTVSDRLARIDAPKYQRIDEANMRQDAGTDLGLIKRKAAGEDFINKLKLQGIRRNPWLDALGMGLSAYGGASMGGVDWGNLGSFGGAGSVL